MMSISNIFKEKCIDAWNVSKPIFDFWCLNILLGHQKIIKKSAVYASWLGAGLLSSMMPLAGALALLTVASNPVGPIILFVLAGIALLPFVFLVITHVVLPAINIAINFIVLPIICLLASLVLVPIVTAKHVIREFINERELGNKKAGYYKELKDMNEGEFNTYVMEPLKKYTPQSEPSIELKQTIINNEVDIPQKKAHLITFFQKSEQANLGRGLTSHLFSTIKDIKSREALEKSKSEEQEKAKRETEQDFQYLVKWFGGA